MYGGINQRKRAHPEMLWTNEAKYFTPYAQALLEKRGQPEPESDVEEFAQRVLELKSLFDAGGAHLLIVGTDEPVYTNLLPGFAYHRELLAMTYAGIPPAAVLKAATINGARALGVDARLGSIEAGKLADLLRGAWQSPRRHQSSAGHQVCIQRWRCLRPGRVTAICRGEDRSGRP